MISSYQVNPLEDFAYINTEKAAELLVFVSFSFDFGHVQHVYPFNLQAK